MTNVARSVRNGLAALAALLLAACETTAPPTPKPTPKPAVAPSVKTVTEARYEAVAFSALPAVNDADVIAAWPAWLNSCRALKREPWLAVCSAAATVNSADARAIRRYFEERFDAYRVLAVTREENNTVAARELEITDTGRITGYYEPVLNGSRSAGAQFSAPLHRAPDDLLTIDLSSVYPELRNMRLRGRVIEEPGKGKRVVPYWSRAELDANNTQRLRGLELVWVDDAIEAFFLQVQGSGRVQLPDGTVIRVGFADVNGHPYRSIGRWLIERGELTFEQASMQGIQAWARSNPQRVQELLNQNPSYVFFRELPLGDPQAGPVGALNVALTPGYSVAVDPRFIALGAPVLIRTMHPSENAELTRFMLAQDTGGAIRGPLRFDFFWGLGRAAGDHAGRQRHDARAWILLPKGVAQDQLGNNTPR